MPLHFVAWSKALSEWNCEFSEDLFYAWGGMPVAGIIAALNENKGLSMPVDDVARRKEELYFEILPQLKPVPEVLEHIEVSYGQIPFAVVSGSTRESVTAPLSALQLLDRFDTLVCAEDYHRKSKPDPQAFLIAASRLAIAPESCLVFEDTDRGFQAATAAGMASIKVPSPWQRKALTRNRRNLPRPAGAQPGPALQRCLPATPWLTNF